MPMPEDLASFDVSSLDALAKLEDDEQAIRLLLEKAAWRRDKEVEVYSRVMADYAVRMNAIVEQASAVRERVRDDLRKLDTLHDRYKEALDKAKVQLHECEFRHEIGEFTPEEFQRCQQAAQQTIAEREAEFEEARKLRLRYIELFPGEPVSPAAPVPVAAPPAAAPVVAPAPPAAAPPPVAAPPPPAAVPPAVIVPPTPPPAPPPVAKSAPPPVPPAPAPDPAAPLGDTFAQAQGATVFLRAPSATDFQVPAHGKMTGDSEQFGTIALTAAMLVEDRSGLPGTHHRLGPLTTIGRTPDNQIVVPVKEVSRRHAEIILKEDGYVVRDHSPNGTFVNGERISEHHLRDGDKVKIGGKIFVFKA